MNGRAPAAGLTMRPLLIAVVGATLLLTGCSTPGASERGTVFPSQATSIEVAVGERFSIKVRGNASIGDNWRVADPKPDPDVVTVSGKDSEGEPSDNSGGYGTEWFIFEAKAPGTTEIVLFNCYRCSNKPNSEDSKQNSRTATYTVEVRK